MAARPPLRREETYGCASRQQSQAADHHGGAGRRARRRGHRRGPGQHGRIGGTRRICHVDCHHFIGIDQQVGVNRGGNG
jgi:hypothetical protein